MGGAALSIERDGGPQCSATCGGRFAIRSGVLLDLADLGGAARRTQFVEEVDVGLGVVAPLVRQIVLVEDRLHRAHRLARAAVDTFVGMDVQHPAALVDAVDRAFLDASLVEHIDARLGDHVGHECGPPNGQVEWPCPNLVCRPCEPDWVGRRVVMRHGDESGEPPVPRRRRRAGRTDHEPHAVDPRPRRRATGPARPHRGRAGRRPVDSRHSRDRSGVRARLAARRDRPGRGAGCCARTTDSPDGPTRRCRCGRRSGRSTTSSPTAPRLVRRAGLPLPGQLPVARPPSCSTTPWPTAASWPRSTSTFWSRPCPPVPTTAEPVEIDVRAIGGLARRLPLSRPGRACPSPGAPS